MSTASLIIVAVAAAAVVAWFVLRRERRPIDAAPTTAEVTHAPKPPVTVPAEVERQVRRLLRERRKIYAIKELVDHTGMSLREAKAYVESLPARPVGSTNGAAPVAHEIPDDLLRRLQGYIREKRKIYAIKELRDHTGMGLREAKEYVEALPLAPIPVSPGAPAFDEAYDDRVPDDLQRRLRQHVRDKRKIHAIKELRDHTGMGLREAKEYVDRL